MIECIRSCHAVGVSSTHSEILYVNKGDKFEDHMEHPTFEGNAKYYTIKYKQRRFISPQSNFINLGEIRDEKINKILYT